MTNRPPPGYEHAEKLDGQTMKLDASGKISEKSAEDRVNEAAATVDELVKVLSVVWGEAGLSPEQCVFALALLTINYRETLPEKYGGKAMFDRVAGEAKRYYDANSGK